VRKIFVLAFATLALIAGCKDSGNKADNTIQPKWKGAPYHLEFDAKAAKPGVLIPPIKYTANPDATEKRGILIVRFDSSNVKTDKLIIDQVIEAPTDIPGTDGTLAADYVAVASKDLEKMLDMYKVTGKVKFSVGLTRSSLNRSASSEEIHQKLLSDWLQGEVDYKAAKAKK
jgi:hypothetical protein